MEAVRLSVSNGMKILIATPLSSSQVGGPAQYAVRLEEAIRNHGHEVQTISFQPYGRYVVGIRHFFFFCALIKKMWNSDAVIALDTFSVAFPATVATRILRKRILLRIGGDFLWERYVNRTGAQIMLSDFYIQNCILNRTEQFIRRITSYILHNADALVFTTEWQRDIFIPAYSLDISKIFVIENYYGEKKSSVYPSRKNFIWATRPIPLKNGDTLKKAFLIAKVTHPELTLEEGPFPYEELQERIRTCYAVVLPSFSEVSPNIILEAIRYNKPFILTKATGFYNDFIDIGLFVDPFSTEDLAEKIVLLGDEIVYKEYQRKIENFSVTHSWSDIAEEFIHIAKVVKQK